MLARRIAYATSEIAPFAKTGGLADVSAALPAHLRRSGREVKVFVPLYSQIEVGAWDFRPVEGLQDVPLRMGRQALHFSVFSQALPGTDVDVLFIHCPRLYDRSGLYTDDADEPIRFGFFSRAVLETCQRLAWAPDVVHSHDWQTALLPVYLRSVYAWDRLFAGTRTVLTIHNLGYQGVFSAESIGALGLGDFSHFLDREDLKQGRIGFLRAGLRHADRITTVSPTYAREIRTAEFGFGLHELLAERGDDVVGILNGVDVDLWNPRTDRRLPFRYSAKSLWRKEKNKEALLAELALPWEKGVPTIGMITRLAGQKGIDLVMDPLDELLAARDVRLLVLASGESRWEAYFAGLEQRHPGRVRFWRGFHADLAHRIEAGSDFFLMPSMYEPCGLNQMYSLRYGTVPIVRKTGGLADTVELYDPKTGEGNGIVFDHPIPDAVRWALRTALALKADPKHWRRLQRNGIERADFSWDAPAREYETLYDTLVGETAETPA